MLDARSMCEGVVVALLLLDNRERTHSIARKKEPHKQLNSTRTQVQQPWQYV
jgi:hypothetical protein